MPLQPFSRLPGVALLSLLVAATAWSGCQSRQERFTARVERAEALAEEGRTQEAILEYSSALKLVPTDAEINERVAALLAAQGETDRAVLYFREAHRQDPDRVEAAMREARLLVSKDRARAERLVASALQTHPGVSIVHRTRSELLLAKGNLRDALGAAVAAARIAPDDPDNWIQIARVHGAQIRHSMLSGREPDDRSFQSALNALSRAETTGGSTLGVAIERASLLAAWPGHEDEAEQAYRAAVALARETADPAQQRFAAGAAAAFAERAKRRELRRWALREVVAADPSALAAWRDLAELEEVESGGGDAVFAELFEARPDDETAHQIYVGFLTDHERTQQAIDHLERVMKGGVRTPALGEQLVALNVAQGRLPSARAAYVELSSEFPDDPITRRVEARLALAEGRPGRAAEILGELQDDADSETLLLLAMAELRSGDLDRALAAVDRALALTPEATAAHRLKARIHHDAGDWSRAARSYDRLLEEGHALSADEELRFARSLYGAGRADEGRARLERLLASDAPPSGAAVEYARREGRTHPERALAQLRAAQERTPADPEVLEALVAQEVAAGEAQQALDRLNRVIASQLAGPRVLLLRARLLAGHDQLDRAEADALRAFEAAPELDDAVDLLVEIYAAQGKSDEAMRSFQEAEEAGVLHWGARVLLARLYLLRGEPDKAQTTLEAVVAERPGAAAAKRDLALTLADRGRDLDRALELAKQARQERPGDPTLAHTVGVVYFQSKRYEAALRSYEKAIALAEANRPDLAPTFHYHAGLALLELGRQGPAAREFEAALALDADFPDAADARRHLEAVRRAS